MLTSLKDSRIQFVTIFRGRRVSYKGHYDSRTMFTLLSCYLVKQSLTSSCSSDENLHRISHNKATLTSLKHFHVVFELWFSRLMGASSKSFPTFGNLSLNYLYDCSVVFAKLQDLSHVQWLWTSLILILLKKFYLCYSVKTWHERIISNSIRTSVRRNG